MTSDLPSYQLPQFAAKQRCTVTVTQIGWLGSRAAAAKADCGSISELLEKIGRGELTVVSTALLSQPVSPRRQEISSLFRPLLRLILMGIGAALILALLLYIADRLLPQAARIDPAAVKTPAVGDIVAGFEITDDYHIRPFHPVTGVANVPHNGVDVATPIGTPVYAVGQTGDRVTVDCWWDVDGGGWVADQSAASYPGYVFQSLHLSENGCQSGQAQAGDEIAYTGNSGLGTGEHYDFRVKISGAYVPPGEIYLESALTGKPPRQ
ncbi:M23 family metallopeptidase [Romeria aff. gracilis LEGE 07310]|uniref:M23 family metallopeptidase n=1 Tax=Vasconcelosia minhoensis LEGE 07310 TaxID=915328 RepID=A0A8J7AYF6_9CYAN|nr:M23 family metallopeptidase [Romeria gracilis]MBE9078567.1 M23 family metallopeptidase [Romeria aff. gracilis LEGE 07310]